MSCGRPTTWFLSRSLPLRAVRDYCVAWLALRRLSWPLAPCVRLLARPAPPWWALRPAHFHVAGWTPAERQVAALWKHLTTSRKSPVTITKADHGVELFDLPSISGSLHVAPRRRWAEHFHRRTTAGLQWHFTVGSEAHCPGRLIVRDFYPSAVASVRSRLHDWADACRNYAATGSNEFSEKRSKYQRTFLIGNAGVGKVLLHCVRAPDPSQGRGVRCVCPVLLPGFPLVADGH